MTITAPRHVSIPFIDIHTRVLWTDASYNHGISGWAVVEDDMCILQDWRRGLTSNLAEGIAIRDALHILGDNQGAVLTDSMCWSEALAGRRRIKGRAPNTILEECSVLLRENRSRVYWVPSHTQVLHGNILADQCAKEARVGKLTVRNTYRSPARNSAT